MQYLKNQRLWETIQNYNGKRFKETFLATKKKYDFVLSYIRCDIESGQQQNHESLLSWDFERKLLLYSSKNGCYLFIIIPTVINAVKEVCDIMVEKLGLIL